VFRERHGTQNPQHKTALGRRALGDSGGPAFWRDPDSGQLVQVGIASLQNPVAAGMAHYCRADLVEVIEFIEGVSTIGAGWEVVGALAALEPAARIASVTVRILTRPSLGARHKTAQKYAEATVIIVDDHGNGVEGARDWGLWIADCGLGGTPEIPDLQ
jgi:hypothetical protein